MVTREIGKKFHALCQNRFNIGRDDCLSGDQRCLHRLIEHFHSEDRAAVKVMVR